MSITEEIKALERQIARLQEELEALKQCQEEEEDAT
jgi:hypothetical protein